MGQQYHELVQVVHEAHVTQCFSIFALCSFIVKEHLIAVVDKIGNDKVGLHKVGIERISQWPQMPPLRHGEAATEILVLNLNLSNNS